METEDLKVESKEPEVETPEKEVSKPEPVEQYSEEEKEALARGWDPEGEYSARTFNKIGKTIAKSYATRKENESLKKELDEIKKGMATLVNHNKQIEEETRRRTLEEIKSRKEESVELGDINNYRYWEQQEREYSRQAVPAPMPHNERVQAEKDFVEKHKSWYNNDTVENYDMATFANNVGQFVMTQNPNINPKEAIKIVEAEVQKRYPHRFSNVNKSKLSPVDSPTRGEKPSKDYVDVSYDELSDTEQRLYRLAESGKVPGLTGKSYIKQLQKLRGRI